MLLKKLLKDKAFMTSFGVAFFGVSILLVKSIDGTSTQKRSHANNIKNPITHNQANRRLQHNNQVSTPPKINQKIFTPTVTGSNVQNILKKKNPNFWVVDQKGSKDSDSSNFAEVYLNAKEGETIKVKEGTYQLPNNLSKNKISIIGLSDNINKVIFTNPPKRSIKIETSKMSFKNLSIIDTGSSFFFLNIEKGNIEFINTFISSESNTTLFNFRPRSQALIKSSMISTHNLGRAVKCTQCNLRITESKIINNNKGIYISDKAKLQVNSTDMINNKTGLYVANHSEANVKNSKFINNQDYGIFLASGEVSLNDSIIGTSRTGITLRPNTELNINNTQILESQNYGIFAANGSRIESSSGLDIVNGGAPFSISDNAYMNLGKCKITGNIKKAYIAGQAVLNSNNCIALDEELKVNRLPTSIFKIKR